MLVVIYGEDALEKLVSNKIDLFVLDIMMPNMDGWEFCREVDSKTCMVPISLFTSLYQQ